MIFSGQDGAYINPIGFCGNTVLVVDESNKSKSGNSGLEKIEDGSVVYNIHTSKWRVFTDSGRDYFFKGKLEPTERLFGSAIQGAKEGFGEKDPHVASACNNLLYRVEKEFDKAKPLYLEAVSVLEDLYGPEDVRVGATLHNLGQLYLVQRKLEEARACYEIIFHYGPKPKISHGLLQSDNRYKMGYIGNLAVNRGVDRTLVEIRRQRARAVALVNTRFTTSRQSPQIGIIGRSVRFPPPIPLRRTTISATNLPEAPFSDTPGPPLTDPLPSNPSS
ncbi:Tetratricopeptide-like helical domain superfamily [Arabidopsis thaliana x Arabidopsis arenosa]|uniref:Tetratricopeptide-like helical domain superfamily n=1 Tax=Arabidopsis thaliana x Arabidopsis arenosa TaxID=1240361 RepID=A0A8T2B1G1_9BRAS|nr:Tetratricopeptide-like helical domain superfamily [Arabidopsis thaliana x Arabidopsis arenosa]